MKRSMTVWLLIVLFTASLARGLTMLFQQSDSAEAELYAGAGIESVFFVLVVASVLLDAMALRYLWAPQPPGLRVGLASVSVTLVFALVSAMVVASQPDLLASVITAREEADGRTVDPEVIEFMTSGKGLSAAVAVSFLKAVLVGWLLWWNRDYFVSRPASVISSTM